MEWQFKARIKVQTGEIRENTVFTVNRFMRRNPFHSICLLCSLVLGGNWSCPPAYADLNFISRRIHGLSPGHEPKTGHRLMSCIQFDGHVSWPTPAEEYGRSDEFTVTSMYVHYMLVQR